MMINSLLRVSAETMEKLDYNGKPNAYGLAIANEIVEILTPFAWATNLSQGENNVTSSVTLPVVRGLSNEINNLQQKYRSMFVTTLKSSFYIRLAQHEQECFKIAAALDPRWKLAWCTADETKQTKQVIIQKVTDLCSSLPNTSITSVDESVSSPTKRSKLFEFMSARYRSSGFLENTSTSTGTNG